MMQISFLQSTDSGEYVRLLQASSRSVIEYCHRHSFNYDMFIGLKRGNKPWHAALNRITILKEFIDQGYSGWLIYLDADAYVADLDFDLPDYLSALADKALVAAHSGAPPFEWWNINNGVLAVNLGHVTGRRIVEEWYGRLLAVPLIELQQERWWSDVIDDQGALHEILCRSPEFEEAVHVDSGTLNWDGRFIRQLVRGSGSIGYRLERLELVVDQLLHGGVGDDPPQLTAELANSEFVKAVYRSVLFREADAVGFATATGQLSRRERTYSDELAACFASAEFAEKAGLFLRTYLTPAAIKVVAEEASKMLLEDG